MPSINKNPKRLIFGRDNGQCVYCGFNINFTKVTIDHIVPKSLGGTNQVWNLCLACKSCNARKRNSMPDDSLVNKIKLRTERFFAGTRKLYEANQPVKRDIIADIREVFNLGA